MEGETDVSDHAFRFFLFKEILHAIFFKMLPGVRIRQHMHQVVVNIIRTETF